MRQGCAARGAKVSSARCPRVTVCYARLYGGVTDFRTRCRMRYRGEEHEEHEENAFHGTYFCSARHALSALAAIACTRNPPPGRSSMYRIARYRLTMVRAGSIPTTWDKQVRDAADVARFLAPLVEGFIGVIYRLAANCSARCLAS